MPENILSGGRQMKVCRNCNSCSTLVSNISSTWPSRPTDWLRTGNIYQRTPNIPDSRPLTWPYRTSKTYERYTRSPVNPKWRFMSIARVDSIGLVQPSLLFSYLMGEQRNRQEGCTFRQSQIEYAQDTGQCFCPWSRGRSLEHWKNTSIFWNSGSSNKGHNHIERKDHENFTRLPNGTGTTIYRHRLHVLQIGTCQFWDSAGELFCGIFPKHHHTNLDYFYCVVDCHNEGDLQETIGSESEK